MSIASEPCTYIQNGESTIIYNYNEELKGYLIIGTFIAPNTRARLAFLKLWQHFLAHIVKKNEIFCCLFTDTYEDSPYKREINYHTEIRGIQVYKVRNFMLDKPAAYTHILDESI